MGYKVGISKELWNKTMRMTVTQAGMTSLISTQGCHMMSSRETILRIQLLYKNRRLSDEFQTPSNFGRICFRFKSNWKSSIYILQYNIRMNMFGLLIVLLSAASSQAQDVKCQIDVAFAIDASGSIWKDQPDQAVGRQNWNDMRNFVASIIGSFTIGQQDTLCAAVRFEDDASQIFNLGRQSKSAMETTIRNLPYDLTGGVTRMDLAMQIISSQIFTNGNQNDRSQATNVVIIVTDGRITSGFEDDTLAIVNSLKRRGTAFVVVGVTDQIDVDQLREIATDAQSIFSVDQFGQLQTLLDRISNQACVVVPTPDLGCPAADNNAVAFSAYAANDGMVLFSQGMTVPFQRTWVNVGGGYDTSTYRFTCQCKGLYEFHVTMSNVPAGLVVAIVKGNDVVSPLAYSATAGAMTTTTIVLCNPNEQVYVQVLHTDGFGLMPCLFNGNSFYGYTGKFLYAQD